MTQYAWAYLWSVLRRFKALLGGSSGFVILVGVIEHYLQNTVHWSVYLTVVVLCLFVALFVSGLENYRRLRPRLAIKPEPMLQEWIDTTEGPCQAYYIEVANLSEETTIEDVNVRLEAIRPEVLNLNWLPVNLHIKHDNNPGRYMQHFSLNPGEKRHIDLAGLAGNSPKISIEHIVQGVNKFIPKGSYELTVTASGKNTPQTTAKFGISVDVNEYLCCVAKEL
jgi:hypothetical protein